MERLKDLYRNAYLGWDNWFSDNGGDYPRFASAPVRNAYWKMDDTYKPYIWREKIIPKTNNRLNLYSHPMPTDIRDMFSKKTIPINNGNTMVFRRYERLPTDIGPYEMDILLASFLGIPQYFGVKRNTNHAILNDSWKVNLIQRRENVMMDAFLRGFGTEFENLKNQWCKTQSQPEKQMGIDVSEELKDLFKVYTDANAHLESKERTSLNLLVNAMESFLAVHKEKNTVAQKLNTLKYKLKENCGCEDDEDGEDDE